MLHLTAALHRISLSNSQVHQHTHNIGYVALLAAPCCARSCWSLEVDRIWINRCLNYAFLGRDKSAGEGMLIVSLCTKKRAGLSRKSAKRVMSPFRMRARGRVPLRFGPSKARSASPCLASLLFFDPCPTLQTRTQALTLFHSYTHCTTAHTSTSSLIWL